MSPTKCATCNDVGFMAILNGGVGGDMGNERVDKWDTRYLALAEHVAGWSKDPSTKVGAVIVSPNRFVMSLGYNGLPRGVHDTEERLNNRELKYKMIVHAERNAIISAERELTGCTLYTWPFMSCGACTAMIIQAGIKRVVAPVNDNPRWAEDFELSKHMYSESCVELHLVELPA